MGDFAKLDSGGRVVIPRSLREELRLCPGDTLAVESDGEGVILRPVRSQSPLRKEKGVWVFRSGNQISAAQTDGALEELRQGRARHGRTPKA